MKKTIRVCDICRTEYPDAYFKYKYRAKHRVFGIYGMHLERIELCEACLRKIIDATYNINKEEQA